MLRLFVAIDLDDGARAAIAHTQQVIAKTRDTNSSLRWVDPSHIHLTLTFLGEVADDDVPAIVTALSAGIDVHPFTVVFQGFGVFPRRGAPRVLWLGVTAGASDVIRTHQVVAGRVADAGVTLERRAFSPHLTVARWRSSSRAAAGGVLSAGPETPIASVSVDHVTLYRSCLSSTGPVYTALAHATLT